MTWPHIAFAAMPRAKSASGGEALLKVDSNIGQAAAGRTMQLRRERNLAIWPNLAAPDARERRRAGGRRLDSTAPSLLMVQPR